MKIYTYRSGHKTLKKVLSITLSLLVLVQAGAYATFPQVALAHTGGGDHTFSASVTPTAIALGATESFTFTVTNTGAVSATPASWEIESFTILVPADFSVDTSSLSVPSGWQVALASNEIRVSSQGSSDQIDPGQSLSVTGSITSTGSTGGNTTWISRAFKNSSFTPGTGAEFHGNGNTDLIITVDPPTDVCPDDEGLQTEGPCTSDDVCPNDAGIQTDPNDCTPQDVCPNDIGLQTSTPCPSDDVCPNDLGIQTNPDDCTPSGPTDVCPNVTGDQIAGPCADQVCTDAGNVWNLSNQTCDTPAAPEADLTITKSVDDSTPEEGQTLVYSLTVTNSGPDNATNVVVSDVLPAGLTYVSASSTAGTYASTTGDWTIGALANGASALLDITVTVNSSTGGQTITNSASADGSENDSDTENNSTSASVVVNTPDQGPQRFTLDVTITGDGTGSVTGNGIDCVSGDVSGNCQETYDAGTVVNITATANEGSNFNNSWTIGGGTCTGNNTPCSVTINSNVSLSAHFGLNQTITTTTSGGGGGSHRGGGIVLGINNDEPQGQVLGATFTPGLPATGNGPINTSSTNTLAVLFAGLVVLGGLNMASFKALKLEVKSK